MRLFSILLLIVCSNTLSISNYKEEAKITRVLILGNSITYHNPSPAVGWNGNWGMAASEESKDYVHLIKARLAKADTSIKFNIGNIANTFERRFWKMDTASLQKFAIFQPELIILRIGENIKDDLALPKNLSAHLKTLVFHLSKNPQTKIVIVGSFWPNKNIEGEFKKVCQEMQWEYISLEGLYKDQANTAIKDFTNKGVARHPSDAGMQRIADRIWNAIEPFFKDNTE